MVQSHPLVKVPGFSFHGIGESNRQWPQLGSTLYEITQGISPYEELPSDEVERLFTEKSSPIYPMYYVDKLSNNAGFLKLIQQRM